MDFSPGFASLTIRPEPQTLETPEMSEGEAKRSVTVRIAGDEHILRSLAEPEYTRRCAEFLDERVTEIREFALLPDNHRAVILAALSITDRYFQAKDELERLKEDVTRRSVILAERVERELGRSAAY
jgi:cell division protein ZapA (FtsZ GTPase activity inhibitor)